MALTNCPECGRQISDTAATCPQCGYDLSKRQADFVPVIKPLSAPKRQKYGVMIAEIIGACILTAVGIPLISAGIGIILIILGVIGFFVALATGKKTQQGECPYCGTMLNIEFPSTENVRCPKCNNVSKRTDTTLESTH